MSANARYGVCPDKCSGGKPDRQMDVHEMLLSRLPESIQSEIKISGSAKRCTYCGLVYLRTTKDFGRRLGFWDSGIGGPGWTS